MSLRAHHSEAVRASSRPPPRHLHFGRAAAELNLSQPAVSIQLKQLEADIGLPLFEQMGRRMHLTRAGEELAGHARAVLVRIREADEALEGLKDAGAGEIHSHRRRPRNISCRVCSPQFRRSHPRLKVRLDRQEPRHVIRELAENTVDLAVMGQAPRGLDTIAVRFARNPLGIIAAPDHPLAKKRRVRLAN